MSGSGYDAVVDVDDEVRVAMRKGGVEADAEEQTRPLREGFC